MLCASRFNNAIFRHLMNANINAAQNFGTPASPQPGIAGQSGRGASVVRIAILFHSTD